MGSGQTAVDRFVAELQGLYKAAGRPRLAQLIRRGRAQTLQLKAQTLSDWFGGRTVPADPAAVRFLVAELEAQAVARNGYRPRGAEWWARLHTHARNERHERRGGRPLRSPRTDVPADVVIPRQLPMEHALIGRGAELDVVRAALAESGVRPPVVAIHGIGGVGKSALAVAGAHAAAPSFVDGQLYVDLQGASPGVTPLTPGEVLARFLRALGTPPERISSEPAEAAARFRSETAGKRLLVVLDNALSVSQLLPLLPSGPGCATLITSRTTLSVLADVVHLDLDVLDPDEAVELLRHHAADRVDSEPEAARELAELCGRLPLALCAVGSRMGRRPGRRVRSEAARIRSARYRLDELGHGDLDVRASIELGYEGLLEAGKDGARAAELFPLLSLIQTSQITPLAAAGLVDVDEATAHGLLDVLADHGLLIQRRHGSWVHDLVREYALELVAEQSADRDAAIERVVARYISTMCAERSLYSPYTPLRTDPVPRAPTGSGSSVDAVDWLADHVPTLGVLVEHLVAERKTVRRAYELLWPIAIRLVFHHPADGVRLNKLVLAGADPADWAVVVPTALNLNNAYLVLGRVADARSALESARPALALVDDDRLHARYLGCDAGLLYEEGAYAAALERATAAAGIYEQLGLAEPLATCVTTAGKTHVRLGQHDAAIAAIQRGISLTQGESHNVRNAVRHYHLAVAYLRSNHLGPAEQAADSSVAAAMRVDDRVNLAYALALRSAVRLALDRADEALTDAAEAIAVAQGLGLDEPLLDARQTYAAVLWRSRDPRAQKALEEVGS